ncbi:MULTISPECIES: hypothetical protein [unclassified Streptomyces]|uniref:hypothetical protein n=1 Tax=unclassified Streptomyces TaxID=2593676 RepID=UPI00380D67F4
MESLVAAYRGTWGFSAAEAQGRWPDAGTWTWATLAPGSRAARPKGVITAAVPQRARRRPTTIG